MRLIDVDELLNKIDEYFEGNDLTSECTGDSWADGLSSGVDDIRGIIQKMLAEQQVELTIYKRKSDIDG